MTRVFGAFLLLTLAVSCHGALTLQQLADEIMNTQRLVEQMLRSDQASGVKAQRIDKQATDPWVLGSIADNSMIDIHDHANNIRVLGMGEFVAILNGYEFWTRHNDYKLVKPGTIKSPDKKIAYGDTVNLDFPGVPPQVQAAGDFTKQVAEMKEWFRAFHEQNITHRDYRPYFKPVLSYLEGYWTIPGSSIDEPFDSDRHSLDAKTFSELSQKLDVSTQSGRKHLNEDLAFLPTALFKDEKGETHQAQWNYKIVCHPIDEDVPTARLRLLEDASPRIANRKTLKEHSESRAARYRLKPDTDPNTKYRYKKYLNSYLDQLMAKVPGLDGYGNNLKDMDQNGKYALRFEDGQPLSAGYYNRLFKTKKTAAGTNTNLRGFADEHLYAALNTQPKIKPTIVASDNIQRWSYAFPLEITYLTPLYNWNPYNIEYLGEAKNHNNAVTDGGKLDGSEAAKALRGTHSKLFFRTPYSLFTGTTVSGTADTGSDPIYVQDKSGVVRQVVASGTRIFIPINGEKIRLRYPIAPASYEGSAVWKEVQALRECSNACKDFSIENAQKPVELTLRTSRKGVPHGHKIIMDAEMAADLYKNPNTKTVTLSTSSGDHSHNLKVYLNGTRNKFMFEKCDDADRCGDGHPRQLDLEGPDQSWVALKKRMTP